MKKLQLLGILLLVVSASYTANAQIQAMNEMSITPPSFKDKVYASLSDYLEASVNYPSRAIIAGLQGTEVIRFAVTTEGNIEDIKVINSVYEEIDREVIQALKNTKGNWDPGTIDGEPAKLVREVSILFAINSPNELLVEARKYLQKGNQLMFANNQPSKAIHYFKKAYTLTPNEESVLLSLGCCLYQLGETTKAEEIRDRLAYMSENGTPSALPVNAKIVPPYLFSAELIVQAR